MIHFAIPSSNRCDLLLKTTLALLDKHEIDYNQITIFCPIDQVEIYDNHFPDIEVVGVPEKGIGRTRTFIRKYYAVNTKIIQIDDDIKDICSIDDSFHNKTLLEYFNECFKIMLEEKVKFSGFCPYDNEYFMKPGYTTNPKYTGGHLILEIIRENPIDVYINHFEDYVANGLYYLMDQKLLRFNGTYVKTKYFNPKGGIIDYYGSMEERKKIAKKLAEKIRYIFNGLLLTCKNKTHNVVNLKFKSSYNLNEQHTKEILSTYNSNKENLEVYAL